MPEKSDRQGPGDDPLWYKDAIIYQTHVKSYRDSDGDGMGDFRGLASKLSYLEDLGINTIWLLPFYPSPLKDDGYDIASYRGVHPAYGSLEDFTRFLHKAHRSGIRVVTELVINHTSDQHPWFRRARKSPPGSPFRDYYVWSDTPEKYRKARLIFKDFESSNWTMDSVAKAYYWHRFYSHQPDLNFDNPAVHESVLRALDFWMRRGVDGVRLDAVPYLYEREGTSCENLPETHAFLKKLRRHIDEHYANRMLLAEANQWPDDAVAYFGDGDECHMNFHFPIMPRMFMALRMEDRFPIVDIMQQTPSLPANCQWATFLRNHDELTLEMVTDRERDYMYQAYARDREMRINLGIRRRLAPLLNNDRRAIELMNALLFSLPGSPIIYYGDEIGMGDNVYLGDRNGVRTPMQWSADRNAGFSRANPQRLYLPVIIDPQFHYENINVESQENNAQSLLWWMRRLIGVRKRFSAFGRGALEFLPSTNHSVLSFLREYDDERLLVVANLSRFAQQVVLDLTRFRGMIPVEVWGQTPFQPIGDAPYSVSLGPYAFYWFALMPQKTPAIVSPARPAPVEIAVTGAWENVLEGRPRVIFERHLPGYLKPLPGFAGYERKIEATRILDVIRLADRRCMMQLLIVQIVYAEGSTENQAIPLAFASGDKARLVQERFPDAIAARLKINGGEEGLLYDAFWDEEFASLLLNTLLRKRRSAGKRLELFLSLYADPHQLLAGQGENGTAFSQEVTRTRKAQPEAPPRAASEPAAVADSPSPGVTIRQMQALRVGAAFDERFFLKTYRRLEPSISPDREVGRFLTAHGFSHTSATLGGVEVGRAGQEPATLAILKQFVPHEKTAWRHTLDALTQYFERSVTQTAAIDPAALPPGDLLDRTEQEVPGHARDLIGFYLTQAALLGQRTAELHLSLASDPDDPAFAPEPFAPFYQRSQYQSMHNLQSRVMDSLHNHLPQLPENIQGEAQAMLAGEAELQEQFRIFRDWKFDSLRIRSHGNYHLPQVLYTGKDFVIIDFQGDPRLSLSERRGKYSCIRDVATMLRSFDYAAYTGLLAAAEGTLPAGRSTLEPWYRYWRAWVPSEFLRAYLATARNAAFLAADKEELRTLLHVRLLQESLRDLWYELQSRPAWCHVPLQAILETLRATRQPSPEPK